METETYTFLLGFFTKIDCRDVVDSIKAFHDGQIEFEENIAFARVVHKKKMEKTLSRVQLVEKYRSFRRVFDSDSDSEDDIDESFGRLIPCKRRTIRTAFRELGGDESLYYEDVEEEHDALIFEPVGTCMADCVLLDNEDDEEDVEIDDSDEE